MSTGRGKPKSYEGNSAILSVYGSVRKNVISDPAETGTKHDCSGEGQQQFTWLSTNFVDYTRCN
jgi:hypothetical protein